MAEAVAETTHVCAVPRSPSVGANGKLGKRPTPNARAGWELPRHVPRAGGAGLFSGARAGVERHCAHRGLSLSPWGRPCASPPSGRFT